ncbi:SCP2 sterol-binding domain-containing protein [Celeribacter sp.]|uniref:SCP2 sterol-binding domain-containing protein n=1 Tax=Celeribacter sp. TaxID=1890673 RepID=UPI003A901E49
MSDPFLDMAKTELLARLKEVNFETSVSMRIKDVGNIFILGHDATISDDRADAAVIASQETFTKILHGTLHPMKAVMFGKLKIAGDAKTAMKFGSLFG